MTTDEFASLRSYLREQRCSQEHHDALASLRRIEEQNERLQAFYDERIDLWHCTMEDRAASQAEWDRLYEQFDAAQHELRAAAAQLRREGYSALADRIGALASSSDGRGNPEHLSHMADLYEQLEAAREARRGIIAACIAVKGRLDQPYPDDERWTPWTRFVEPALRRLDEALGPSNPASIRDQVRAIEGPLSPGELEETVTRALDSFGGSNQESASEGSNRG